MFDKRTKFKLAKVFYKNRFLVMSDTVTVDSEGGTVKTHNKPIRCFNGNAHFMTDRQKLDYGIKANTQIVITTSLNANVNINDIIKYNDVSYLITNINKFDNYERLEAIKWQ